MPNGILTGISEWRIFGLPVGAVAGGAIVGGVGDALSGAVVGLVPQAPSWAVKAAAAWAVVQWGPKIIGKEVAQVGALFLTYDAVQELFNLRGSIANIISGVVGGVKRQSPPVALGPKGVIQPNAAARDYYSAAEGRR